MNRLDKKIESGKQRLAAFAGYAATAFAAGAYGAYRMVDAASHADEALNVLSRTFGTQTDAVLEWSKTAGDVMSRSMYDLQDSAGKFGAFLEPQFKGSTENIAAMSQKLTELSVDLASFYNYSDEEASMRLFSGLSGETEAVRKMGVDISDTSLDDFNKKFGDEETKHKRMAALSLQEKTLLRYRKILSDTVGKWNDAALTANSWANQLKALRKAMHEFAVTLGRELIPFAKQLLKGGHALVEMFKTLTLRTDALRDAFIALAYVGLATMFWNIGAAIHGAGLIGGVAQLTAGIETLVMAAGGLAALAVFEDMASFLQGKQTITGDLITIYTGLQRPLQAIEDIAENIAAHFHNAYVWLKALGGALGGDMVGGKGVGALFGMDDRGDTEAKTLKQLLDEAGGLTDVDGLTRQKLANRRNAFRASAEGNGAYDPSTADPYATADAAQQSWLDMREASRKVHPELGTPEDVARGLTHVSGVDAPPPLAPNAYGPPRAPNPVVQGVTIYVNGTSDPALVAKKVAEQLEALRKQPETRDKFNKELQSANRQVLGGAQ